MTGILMHGDSTLAGSVYVATNRLQRLRGLMWRRPLDVSFGLALPGAKQIHTFGMTFPIDVVFCDRSLRVLHLERAFPARRISRWVRGADVVFELPPGAARGVRPGDLLLFHLADKVR